jgi:hypothetical protein
VDVEERGERDASAEEEDNGEAKSRTRARRAVKKGMSAATHLKCRARCVSETFAQTRACPGKTGAHSCDASIPADYMNL